MDVNMVLFDDFEGMDVFGPAEILGKLQKYFHIRYLSVSGDIINSVQGAKIWTDFLIPEETEGVLLIPGGKGARRLLWQDERTLNLVKRAAENADTCLMVGSGSAILAQTGLLYRRKLLTVLLIKTGTGCLQQGSRGSRGPEWWLTENIIPAAAQRRAWI